MRSHPARQQYDGARRLLRSAGRAGAHSRWITVRYGKRGRRRHIPLEQDALDAITTWVRARPTCGLDELLVPSPPRYAHRGR